MLGCGSIIGKSKIRLRGGFGFLNNPTKIGIGLLCLVNGSSWFVSPRTKYYIYCNVELTGKDFISRL